MWSLRRKLVTLICSSVFVIFVALSTVGAFAIHRLVAAHNVESMTMLAKQKVIELNTHMASVERAVKTLENYVLAHVDAEKMKNSPAYREHFVSDMIPFALEAAQVADGVATVYFRPDPLVYGTLTGFFLIGNGKGNFLNVIPTDILQYASNDREHVGWYYEPKEEGKPIWIEPYSNKNINVYMISYVIPLYIDGLFFGIVGMDMNMATIHQVVEAIDYENGFGFLLSQKGSLLYHHDFPEGVNVVQFTDELLTASDYLLNTRKNDEESIGQYWWHGKKHYLSGADMQNGMVMAISVPAEEVMKPIVRMRLVMAIIFVGVILLVICAIGIIMRHVVLPVGELTNAAFRISRGELNHPIKFSSDDEIGKLADSIRKMAAELREYISYIHTQAYTDAMTGVGNKAAYMDCVKLMDRKIHERLADFALIVFDVNGLKRINDTYGHEVGDVLIADAADVIKTAFGSDSMYRIGGDEFVIIKEKVTKEDVSRLFDRFGEVLKEFNKNPRQYTEELTISFGSTFFDGDEDYKTVFQRADGEMYKHKQQYYKGHHDRRQR